MSEEYIMFVDETNNTNKNPLFCLSGFIIPRSYYEDVLIEKVNELKMKYFNNEHVIFHFSEIRNNKGEFEILKDPVTRNKFYTDFVNIIKQSPSQIIAVYFNKTHMNNTYGKCANSNYDVAFKELLQIYVHFLKTNKATGMVIVESRTFQQNAMLQDTFYNYLKFGSELFKSVDVSSYLKCLGFIVKGENCIGLQIVDFIPRTITRIMNGSSDKFSLQTTVKEKLYFGDSDYKHILGVKNILG